MTKYMEGKLSFVLFKNGTFCFFKAGLAPDQNAANEKLEALNYKHVDFRVIPMKDGNYLVDFGDPIVGLLLKDEAAVLASGSRRDLEVGIQVKAALHMDIEERIVTCVVSNA